MGFEFPRSARFDAVVQSQRSIAPVEMAQSDGDLVILHGEQQTGLR
jgi:hypothetical protein